MNSAKRNKIIRIGLDFDGVLAYNPFNMARAPIKWVKAVILGKKKLSFFVPKNKWQRKLWVLIHESSVFPANGTELLKELANNENIEFHLITGRFGCLEENLLKWLNRYGLGDIFKSININYKEEQPHIYKGQIIDKLKLDIYIEDNFDIVEYLNNMNKAKIAWVFNFIDRDKKYSLKFRSLKEALETLVQ